MTVTEFLRPRFCGSRFDGAAIPLEVLQDLAVLEEMLIEVAKWRFLEEHEGRKRSPRGFTRGIELKLTAVEDGSAVPVISLVESPAVGADVVQFLQSARERIVDTIAAAEQGKDVSRHLPNKCLAYFDRFGRSLREGEAIELSTPGRGGAARLTPATRRRLVEASTIRQLTEEVTLRGSVPESDQDKMSFTFQLIAGPKVSSPMPEQHVDTILEAFNGYREGVRVLVQGIGQFSRQRTLQRLTTVEHVSLLEPLDVPAN